MSNENTFNKWNIGDSAKIIHVIKEKDLEDFVKLTGDDNPLHMDEKFAE